MAVWQAESCEVEPLDETAPADMPVGPPICALATLKFELALVLVALASAFSTDRQIAWALALQRPSRRLVWSGSSGLLAVWPSAASTPISRSGESNGSATIVMCEW